MAGPAACFDHQKRSRWSKNYKFRTRQGIVEDRIVVAIVLEDKQISSLWLGFAS